MANEIQPGYGTPEGTIDLLFYYPIPSGQRIAARDSAGSTTGSNVVATPSASAPAWAELAAGEISDLDAGNSAFVVVQMTQAAGESDAAFLARIQARYANDGAAVLAAYQAKFRHLNKRFNA